MEVASKPPARVRNGLSTLTPCQRQDRLKERAFVVARGMQLSILQSGVVKS